ncbi:Calcium homeostasis protein Regucalcin [Penicillium canariense]|uniref:Calcium homeostasis protein Regucalcin n=1 Tax=Penicillium canariense TaxID=189055 RepID=A0A9W9LTJ1_9EURO|nr:Calcium homeostasis protein Regucalcin [Penicillium canariense]KAJ5175174.1 Calcium homeostasis protein Regucalcin [Penicillium canariense]
MSEIQRWTVDEPYLDIPGTLLEGPFHDAALNELRFVDIWEHKLYRLNLAQGPDSLKTIHTDAAIGVTANIAGEAEQNQLIVGAKHGFARLNRTTGKLSYIAQPWEQDGPKQELMRFNDGAVDSHGRFWAGAMNDPKVQSPRAEGVLFRLDPDLRLHQMLAPVTIPNGIGWNAADDTMYWTDSPTGKIFAFDFDAATGAISNRRVHFDLSEPLEPDGFAIDVEGCLWSAIYGGGKVLRIAPDGRVIGQIDLPTRNPTCPAFVGTELFITSAKDDRDDAQFPQSVRYGGRLFRVDVGVRGQPKNEFRIQAAKG